MTRFLALWAALSVPCSLLVGLLLSRSRPPGTAAGTGGPPAPVPAVEPLAVCPCGTWSIEGVIDGVATHVGCGPLRPVPASPEVRHHAQEVRS